MEDSNAMTIDFLRARLLSERSVSRSVRQRAEELANRVAELEEQLKIVSMQRKMAEKATADVLAILEDNGISEISEALDSNSDQETPCASKTGEVSMGDDLCSVNSKARKSEFEDLSGSDPDSSSVIGSGLSWKGRNSSPRPLGKYKDYSMRRQRSITSVGSSSPKHSMGRSCRQIKRKESRLIDDDFKTEPLEDHSEDNAVAISSEVSPNSLIDDSKTLREVSDIQEEKVLLNGTFCSLSQNQGNVKTKDLDFDEYRRENDMEKALENQAQLIDRYEAMEKAQRDWEEKFRENNSSTPDSCDHGNHSDITDEREEIRAHPPPSSPNDLKEQETDVDDVQMPKMEEDGICISDNLSSDEPNGFLPQSSFDTGDPKTLSDAQPKTDPQLFYDNIGNSQYNEEESTNRRSEDDSVSQSAVDFTFPMHKTKETERILENRIHLPAHSSEQKELLGDQSFQVHVLDSKSNVSKINILAGRNDERSELVPWNPGLVGVLDALKQARLSLQKKINDNSPVVEGDRFRKGIESSIFAPKNGGIVDRLTGYAGLFRLPTDYSVESYTRTNFLRSSSQLKVPHSYPNEQNSASSSEQFAASPYSDPRSRFSSNDRIYPDDRNRIAWTESPQRPLLDRYSNNLALPSSTYNSQAPPQNEEFSRTFLGRGAKSPLGSEYSRYEDHNRHGMYR